VRIKANELLDLKVEGYGPELCPCGAPPAPGYLMCRSCRDKLGLVTEGDSEMDKRSTWTETDIRALKQAARDGKSMAQAAEELGRTMSSVQKYASKHKIRFNGRSGRKTASPPPPRTPDKKPDIVSGKAPAPSPGHGEDEMWGEELAAAIEAEDFNADEPSEDQRFSNTLPPIPAKERIAALERELVDTHLRLIGATVEATDMPLMSKQALQNEVDRVRELVGR